MEHDCAENHPPPRKPPPRPKFRTKNGKISKIDPQKKAMAAKLSWEKRKKRKILEHTAFDHCYEPPAKCPKTTETVDEVEMDTTDCVNVLTDHNKVGLNSNEVQLDANVTRKESKKRKRTAAECDPCYKPSKKFLKVSKVQDGAASCERSKKRKNMETAEFDHPYGPQQKWLKTSNVDNEVEMDTSTSQSGEPANMETSGFNRKNLRENCSNVPEFDNEVEIGSSCVVQSTLHVVDTKKLVPYDLHRELVELKILGEGLEHCEACYQRMSLLKAIGIQPFGLAGYIYIMCECGALNKIPLGKRHSVGNKNNAKPFDVNTKCANGQFYYLLS